MVRFGLYGIVGWCCEIIWTAAGNVADALVNRRRPDARLTGHTYLWMFLIYGGGGLLFELAHAVVRGWPLAARGVIYMLGCFAIEYTSGWTIRRAAGTVPWDYSESRWHVHNLIRLDYAPVWFAFGLLLEWVERLAHAVDPVLRTTF